MNSFYIPSSKSISNRLLILQAIYNNITIDNLSTAQDTVVLKKALNDFKNGKELFNIGHAGTAMRFLTAYLSMQKGKTTILDGSERMRERPIGILVDALQQLGADIKYIDKQGYPPLKITGKKLINNEVTIDASVSSQYISALLLMGASLPEGLTLKFKNQSVSKPYVEMTLSILAQLGIKTHVNSDSIQIFHTDSIENIYFPIEGDWSSASYFYGAIAVLRNQKMQLQHFYQHSLQGDRKLVEIFAKFGVKTQFLPDGIIELSIDKDYNLPQQMTFDLLETPDLAQTIAVVCLALKIDCHLLGLQTLRIKETDRLLALKNEIEKLGATVNITDSSLILQNTEQLEKGISIATYKDHRMAMSFAILSKIHPINILNKEVVIKSFPDFWEVFDRIG